MPRKLIKRWIPAPEQIKRNDSLKFLGKLLHDPYLFHLNRHSVAVAFLVGIAVAFLPIPGQMLAAACGALVLRCNLPIAVSLVWISNPFTFLFIYYGTYRLGATLMGLPPRDFQFELSWSWLQTEFLLVWQPLVLGSIIASIFFGLLGYFTVNWMWRWHVISRWKNRKILRRKKDKVQEDK